MFYSLLVFCCFSLLSIFCFYFISLLFIWFGLFCLLGFAFVFCVGLYLFLFICFCLFSVVFIICLGLCLFLLFSFFCYFGFFVCLLLLYYAALGALVLSLGVRPEPLLWQCLVQVTGLTEKFTLQGIWISVSSPRGPHLSTKTQLNPTVWKCQCWTP